MSAAWRTVAGVLGLLTCLGLAPTAATAQQPGTKLNVVVTIRPIHSLTAAVMQGIGEPRLLVEGSASPHTFVMKPSDAKALSDATLVIRVSEGLEPFTAKVLPSLPKKVAVLTLETVSGLTLHPIRTGENFEPHDDGHKGHGHGHKHSPAKSGTQAVDGHIWLDPQNAKVIARQIAEALAKVAPGHAERFRANAAALDGRLDALNVEIGEQVKPVAGRSYIVFHDAYQYFERRYGIQPVGSVTISPDVQASAKRIAALRRKVADLKVACVFAEPQFAPKLVEPIIEGMPVRRGTLDPLGAAIPTGPEHYFLLMRTLAGDLRACLSSPA